MPDRPHPRLGPAAFDDTADRHASVRQAPAPESDRLPLSSSPPSSDGYTPVAKLTIALPPPLQGDQGLLRDSNKPGPLLHQPFQSAQPLSARDPSFSLPAAARAYPEQPQSPRERLDALLASEPSAYTTPSRPDSTPSTTPTPLHHSPLPSPLPLTAAKAVDSPRRQQHLPSHGQISSYSAAIRPPPLGASPPTPTSPRPSTTSALSAVGPGRPDIRPVMPRNSSIDSAISSASSSATRSTRSTPAQDYRASTVANGLPQSAAAGFSDVAGLVAAAGSAEAALQSLWKDRQNMVAHNSQLWRLVEKQRAMILGLNKDLERALKEKDRYRKKVKDLSAPTGSTSKKPKSLSRTDSGLDREQIPVSPPPQLLTHAEVEVKPTDFPAVPVAISEQPEPTPRAAPEAVKSPQTATIIPSHDKMRLGSDSTTSPVPADSASFVESLDDCTSLEVSPTTATSAHDSSREGSSAPPLLRKEALERSTMESSKEQIPRYLEHVIDFELPKSPQEQQLSPKVLTPPRGVPAPTPVLAVIEATPIPDTGAFPSPPTASKLSQRKAAPKPLDLSQATHSTPDVILRATAALAANINDQSKSDDADDRGRRRTRQEDDQIRTDAAIREQEARSASKKSSKSSKSKTPVQAEQPRLIEVPATPSALLMQPPAMTIQPPSAPLVSPTRHGQNPSISSLLSPTGSEIASTSITVHRSPVSTPLFSPGLPLSPRPIDRPPIAPSFPKLDVSTPPLSPRLPIGLPASPRFPPPMAHKPHLERKTSNERQLTVPGAVENPLFSPSAFPPPLFSKPPTQAPPPVPGQGPPPPPPEVVIQTPDDQSPEPTPATAQPRLDTEHISPTSNDGSMSAGSSNFDNVYRGFMSEQYPASYCRRMCSR